MAMDGTGQSVKASIEVEIVENLTGKLAYIAL